MCRLILILQGIIRLFICKMDYFKDLFQVFADKCKKYNNSVLVIVLISSFCGICPVFGRCRARIF